MSQVDDIAAATAIESIPCSRCGGTGHYSYCSMHGTRCFKCGGAKRVHTKRGAAAAKFLEELRSVPVEQIAPGDLMRVEMFVGAGSYRFFMRVESIELRPSPARRMNPVTGEWEAFPDDWAITGSNDKHGRVTVHMPQGELVRKGWTADEKAAQLRKALAYQATLTKAGTVRKSSQKEGAK